MPTLLATRNPGKLKEVKEIVGDHLGELVTLDAFPQIGELPEDFDTFLANARQKAWTAARLAGVPALSDDSGLIVDALGGAPGVYSAMYAGQHGDHAANRKKLLDEMREVPAAQRTARFTTMKARSRRRASARGPSRTKSAEQAALAMIRCFLCPNTSRRWPRSHPPRKTSSATAATR